MSEKIKLGISSCLLGENVRYDGGHQLDHYIRDTLGQFVDWGPVCPEGSAAFRRRTSQCGSSAIPNHRFYPIPKTRNSC
jgi:hypothetical protein